MAAAYSKRRREDTLPLRSELVNELRLFLARLIPSALVFKMPKPDQIIDMLKADLAEAGIVYRDDAGRVVDFHALRHTFISNLAAGGVHPKTAQTLARHSTITLTMDRYSHSYRGEQSAALAVLPDLSPQECDETLATGTDATVSDVKNLARCLAQIHGSDETPRDSERLKGSTSRRDPVNATSCQESRKSDETRNNGEGGIRTRGTGNTQYDGLANRCLQPLGHLSRYALYRCKSVSLCQFHL